MRNRLININQNLDEIISYTRQIIDAFNTEQSIDYKLPYLLKYFCYITSQDNFEFIRDCVKNKNSLACQFSKFNVQFADTLYYDIILSGYFENTNNPIISMVDFSDQLTNIIDMYGVSIYRYEEYK